MIEIVLCNEGFEDVVGYVFGIVRCFCCWFVVGFYIYVDDCGIFFYVCWKVSFVIEVVFVVYYCEVYVSVVVFDGNG